MKRQEKTQPEKKLSPDDLLDKLKKLDEEQLKDIHGGGRCNTRCGGHR